MNYFSDNFPVQVSCEISPRTNKQRLLRELFGRGLRVQAPMARWLDAHNQLGECQKLSPDAILRSSTVAHAILATELRAAKRVSFSYPTPLHHGLHHLPNLSLRFLTSILQYLRWIHFSQFRLFLLLLDLRSLSSFLVCYTWSLSWGLKLRSSEIQSMFRCH